MKTSREPATLFWARPRKLFRAHIGVMHLPGSASLTGATHRARLLHQRDSLPTSTVPHPAPARNTA